MLLPQVRGVALRNSPDWTSLYRRCEHVIVSNVTISGDNRWPNNDGATPPLTHGKLSHASLRGHVDSEACTVKRAHAQGSTWSLARTSR